MTPMRIRALFLSTAVAALTPIAAAADVPPVLTIRAGGCPTGYVDVASAGATHVCVIAHEPEVFLPPHCPAGSTAVGSATAGVWVCVRV